MGSQNQLVSAFRASDVLVHLCGGVGLSHGLLDQGAGQLFVELAGLAQAGF